MFCFAIVNVFVKLLLIAGIPAHELVLFRSVISISFCLVVIKRLGIPTFGVNRKWLLLRGLFGTLALFLFFVTLDLMPLAVATTIQYLSPIFTIIFAIYLNNQKVYPVQYIFFLMAFLGVFLLKVEDLFMANGEVEWLPVILGISSAFLSGMAYNAIIKCKSTDHPITIVMYFPLVAIPLMLIMSIYDFQLPEGIQWLYVVLMGCFTQMAQVYMTRALTSEKASVVTPYKYIGSVFAISFGMIFFNEYLSLMTLIGIAVVLMGILANTVFEKRSRKIKKY